MASTRNDNGKQNLDNHEPNHEAFTVNSNTEIFTFRMCTVCKIS